MKKFNYSDAGDFRFNTTIFPDSGSMKLFCTDIRFKALLSFPESDRKAFCRLRTLEIDSSNKITPPPPEDDFLEKNLK
jgi:hypothetical protein